MKTIHVVWMLALAAPPMLGSSACATRMPGERMDDMYISSHVQRRLTLDPAVERFRIDVDTIDHVVTLRGKVDSPAMKESAERIARDTAGVRGVDNQLVVDPDNDDDGDLGIRMRLGRRLSMAADVDRANIDIDVQDAVVTLSGVVHDERAKTMAAKVARETKGVTEVRNELTVNPDDQLFRRDGHPEEARADEAPPSKESPPDDEAPPSDEPVVD